MGDEFPVAGEFPVGDELFESAENPRSCDSPIAPFVAPRDILAADRTGNVDAAGDGGPPNVPPGDCDVPPAAPPVAS